jgi:metal-dependent amidase/aminoacylase/carboxypeptidase family protein
VEHRDSALALSHDVSDHPELGFAEHYSAARVSDVLGVEFTGFTPPSMHPEQGRSAADALTLTQVAVGLMRQHLQLSDRISGYIVAEGASPNVLPAHARLRYCIRAADMWSLRSVEERLRNCVCGAATATQTEAAITEPFPAYDAMRHHEGLLKLYRKNALDAGRRFESAETENQARSASTDFGNLAQVIPAIHPLIGVPAEGVSNHQAGFTQACRGESGDLAVADGGLILAWTITDLALDPTILTAAQQGGGEDPA